MEQAPGPRGSPQVPQDPAVRGGDPAPLPPTANTESWRARSSLRQEGHVGAVEPLTRLSKRFRQFRQTYSKIGISDSLIAWFRGRLSHRRSATVSRLSPHASRVTSRGGL